MKRGGKWRRTNNILHHGAQFYVGGQSIAALAAWKVGFLGNWAQAAVKILDDQLSGAIEGFWGPTLQHVAKTGIPITRVVKEIPEAMVSHSGLVHRSFLVLSSFSALRFAVLHFCCFYLPQTPTKICIIAFKIQWPTFFYYIASN